MIRRAPWIIMSVLLWLIGLGCAVWAFGALHYDFPVAKPVIPWVFTAAVIAAVIFLRRSVRKVGAVFFAFALVLAWWRTLEPSNDGNWQPDVAQLAWADINGDEFTFH